MHLSEGIRVKSRFTRSRLLILEASLYSSEVSKTCLRDSHITLDIGFDFLEIVVLRSRLSSFHHSLEAIIIRKSLFSRAIGGGSLEAVSTLRTVFVYFRDGCEAKLSGIDRGKEIFLDNQHFTMEEVIRRDSPY